MSMGCAVPSASRPMRKEKYAVRHRQGDEPLAYRRSLTTMNDSSIDCLLAFGAMPAVASVAVMVACMFGVVP